MVLCTVIGCGVLGIKIAALLAQHGHEVRLFDRDSVVLNSIPRRILEYFSELEKDGFLLRQHWNISTHSILREAVNEAEWIFEAVVDDLDIKMDLFEKICQFAKPNAIVSSSTLYLNIDDVMTKATGKERTLGLRFLFPVYYVPEVEIQPTTRTSNAVLDKVHLFLSMLNKKRIYRNGLPMILSVEEITERKRDMLAKEHVRPNRTLLSRGSQLGSSYQDIYKVESEPRGLVLIVNNKTFKSPFRSRVGSEVDVKRLKKMFKAYNYSVIKKRELTAVDLDNVVKEFSSRDDLKDVDSLVIVLMSHGYDGGIYGIDGAKVDIAPLLAYFDNDVCAALCGKPKLFMVQACRIKDESEGATGSDETQKSTTDMTSIQQEDRQPSVAEAYDNHDANPEIVNGNNNLITLFMPGVPEEESRRPGKCDQVIAYATLPGDVAWRDRKEGSPYVNAVCEVFSLFGCNKHILDLLTRVNKRMIDDGLAKGQVPQPFTTLTKDFYLSTKELKLPVDTWKSV